MRKKLLSACVLSLIITACGSKKTIIEADSTSNRLSHHTRNPKIKSPEKSPWEIKDEKDGSDNLLAFVGDWEGTPHRLGGNTQKGVDCSGFVIQAYLQVYNISFLGRRAEDLFGETDPIKRDDLQQGDLVFFKINGRRIDHVGIYIKDGDFAHASSSRGVMISNLNEAYYDKRFFMGGRKK